MVLVWKETAKSFITTASEASVHARTRVCMCVCERACAWTRSLPAHWSKTFLTESLYFKSPHPSINNWCLGDVWTSYCTYCTYFFGAWVPLISQIYFRNTLRFVICFSCLTPLSTAVSPLHYCLTLTGLSFGFSLPLHSWRSWGLITSTLLVSQLLKGDVLIVDTLVIRAGSPRICIKPKISDYAFSDTQRDMPWAPKNSVAMSILVQITLSKLKTKYYLIKWAFCLLYPQDTR